MKENRKVNSESIKVLKKGLMTERARVDEERQRIQLRLEELRKMRQASIFGNTAIDANGPLNLNAVENGAYQGADSVISAKIEKLQRVLTAGHMVDAEYRKAAVAYLDAIEPEVKRLYDMQSACIEEKVNLKKTTEERCEELDRKACELRDEIDNLLNTVGGTVFCTTGEVSGPYVVNKIRSSIRKYEKGV